MTLAKTLFSLAAALLLMAGCAFAPVEARYGKPTRAVPVGSGIRLQYSRQPAGQSVVMVDLDAAGKVMAATEVMTPQAFSIIEPGKWTREDVEREFGPPASVDRVASWKGDIMTYRWRENNIQDMYFWVYLDARQVVGRTGQGMEIPFRTHDD